MNTKKAIIFPLLAFVLFMTTMTSLAQTTGDKLPPIKYQEFTLPNGLRVIMHIDKSTPIVAVNVWYHVGSKNEVAGRTGFAHLFEHMMFQGSKNYDADYFTPLQVAGANVNGSTNVDRTNYFEVLPSNFLELALFMEADRMGGLLDAMTQEKLDNQRDVVKNERRQNYDNQPYGTAYEKIYALMYPKTHPYSWTTIGSLDDVTAASQDDVKGFFRQYYVPNNASLVIAGDFDPQEAKKLVEKHFGPIAKGTMPINRPNQPMPKLDKEIRATYEDNVQLPRLYMAWFSAPRYTQEEAKLDMLAWVLSAGRGSRLQSNLVYGKQIAQDAFANNPAQEISGLFQITATAKPGKTLEEIEREINAEIERIKKEPPTQEELTRALNQFESGAIYSLQTVLGKADQMNGYATYLNKPDSFNEEIAKYRKVTPADVQKAAQTYLTDKRLVMSFVPRPKDKEQPKTNAASNMQASVSNKEKAKIDDSKLPKPTADPKFSLPKIEKSKLSNGLEVWLVKQNELPIVSMNMVFKSGTTNDPQGLSGLGGTTAALLDDGTKTRSAVDIANQVQSIGAQLSAGSGIDSANIRMLTLTKNFDKALDIYADVIQNADFPEQEVSTFRNRALVSLKQRRDNANAISNLVYNRILYGDKHPYGVALSETSINAINRDNLKQFYSTYYRPNNAVLIVVGDAEMKMLTPKLEAKFKDWKAGEMSTMTLPTAPVRDKATIYVVDKPGSAQSVISIGQIGVARDNPDYFPLQVMNMILGGDFASRLNMNLREDKGYSYGAYSGFSFRRGAGPFSAGAGVQTAVTKQSVMEFLKEIRGIRGEIPVTQAELDYNKQSVIRSYPAGFETVDQIAGQLASSVVYNLPENYFADYISRINAVTLADVNRVANKYLTPDKLAIVVVGDRKTIEPGLKEIEGLGNSIVFLDPEGNSIQ